MDTNRDLVGTDEQGSLEVGSPSLVERLRMRGLDSMADAVLAARKAQARRDEQKRRARKRQRQARKRGRR